MIYTLPYTLYTFEMIVALSGWLILILFPRRPWANFWLAGLILPLLFSFIGILILAAYWFKSPAGHVSAFLGLDGVYTLFSNRGLLLALWANLLAMELVGGAWMARKATQIRMPLLRLIPCLILGSVFAGFGFVLFWVMTAMGGGWPEVAKFEEQPPVNTSPVAACPTPAPAPSKALFGSMS